MKNRARISLIARVIKQNPVADDRRFFFINTSRIRRFPSIPREKIIQGIVWRMFLIWSM
jgi:hypothetical protein